MKCKVLLVLCILASLLHAKEPVTHVVLCWMDTSLTETQVDDLITETQKLDRIPGVEKLSVGRPVHSERTIVDDSFTFGITMEFESVEAMNAYLKHPAHTQFVTEKIKPLLVKLLVYDIGL